MSDTVEKGVVLHSTKFDRHVLVLAVTKDGKRAKLHVYGDDRDDKPIWHPIEWYEIAEAGLATCYKCGGSGIYYFGGPVVNGVYQGKTGICFPCEGKGKQDNADRIRCHFYWHRHGKDCMPDDFDTPNEEG